MDKANLSSWTDADLIRIGEGEGDASPEEWEAVVAELTRRGYDTSDAAKVCPFCAETIRLAATKCRYCGEFLDEAMARANAPQSVSEKEGDRRSGWTADQSAWMLILIAVGIQYFNPLAMLFFGFFYAVAFILAIVGMGQGQFLTGFLAMLASLGAPWFVFAVWMGS